MPARLGLSQNPIPLHHLREAINETFRVFTVVGRDYECGHQTLLGTANLVLLYRTAARCCKSRFSTGGLPPLEHDLVPVLPRPRLKGGGHVTRTHHRDMDVS